MTSHVAQQFLYSVLDDLDHQRLVLPTLPEVALRVRDAIDGSTEVSSAEIARVIASDTALSARLVRVANSPLLRGGHHIDTLEAAIIRLGHRLVRDLVISMAMEQMFQATSELTDRSLRETWEHSRQVAAICHVLAGHVRRIQPQQAMLAGLVHDVGVLPILTRAEEMPEILAHEAAFEALVHKLHPKVGGAILRAWDFPDELVRVAEEHERLDRDSPYPDLVDIVIVANLQSKIGSSHPYAVLDWAKVPAFDKVGLSPELNVIELEETAEAISEVEAIFS